MAKRKTVKKKIDDTITASPSVGYIGNVKVSIIKNNKVYSTRTFKNDGRWPLFYFLCASIAGNSRLVASYRPLSLRLFHAGEKGAPVPTINILRDLQDIFKQENQRTYGAVKYNSSPNNPLVKPVVATSDDPIGSCSVTFKFMIPFNQLNTQDAINALALYSSANGDDDTISEPSAYVFVTEENSQSPGSYVLSDILDPEIVADSNFNVYIEWTLAIKNI